MLLVLAAGGAADKYADDLFQRIRDKVLDNSRRLPRYTCVETISRSQYQRSESPARCESLIAMRRVSPDRGQLVVRDRLRLDVAVVADGEMFSWAGARKFESHRIDEIVGEGAAGSGEFGSFLRSVFGGAPDRIGYDGLVNKLALFEFSDKPETRLKVACPVTVPLARSAYRFRTDGPEKTIAYHGTFLADPSTGDLEQLVVESEDFTPRDNVCRVRHTMNYQGVKIGDGDFRLPRVSTMEGLYRNGTTSLNETHYSSCREYVGESSISFGDVAADAAGGPAV